MSFPGSRCTLSSLLVVKGYKRSVVLCGSVRFRVGQVLGASDVLYCNEVYDFELYCVICVRLTSCSLS